MSDDILVLGYFGFGNAGDDALGVAAVKEVLARCDEQDVTVTVGEESVFEGYDVDTCALAPRSSLREIVRADAVVATGGTHLHDHGTTRLPRVKVFLFYLLVTVFSQLSGAELHLLGHGIGPVSNPVLRCTTWVILELADTVTVRDPLSQSLAERYADATLTFDLVATLVESAAAEERTSTLGISLTPGFVRYYDDPLRDDRLVEQLASVLNANSEDDRWSGIRVFVMNTGTNGADARLSRRLVNELERPSVEMVSYEHDPEAFIRAVGSVDSFLGMRFHSLVFAYLNKVPTAAISYHPKCEQFQRYVDITPAMTIEMERTSRRRIKLLLDTLDGNASRFDVGIDTERASELARANFDRMARRSDVL